MPSKHPHPGLTQEGWTSSSIHVADQMLSDFFLSEASQTFAWRNNVKSFPYYLQQSANDPDKLAIVLQEKLTGYFSEQFSSVQVEVQAIKDPDSISKHQLSFYISFSDTAGEVFNLSRLLTYSGLNITEISKILQG